MVYDRKLVERNMEIYPDTEQGDTAFRAIAGSLAAITVIPSETERITAFKAVPGLFISKGYLGFTNIEVVENTDGFYIRETITGGLYFDSRPRYYQINSTNVGSNLNFGPVKRGGVYMVTVRRYDTSKPIYGHETDPNNTGGQYNNMQMHVVWVILPGPIGEPSTGRWPTQFRLTSLYIQKIKDLIPTFQAGANVLAPSYRFGNDDTMQDYYYRGSTHGAQWSDETGTRLFLTTGIDIGGFHGFPNIDNMGEQVFRALSNADIDTIVNTYINEAGIYFTDLEKTENYGDPSTYWSIPLENATLPKYYYFLTKIKQRFPNMLIGEYYRNLVWNKSFLREGYPQPLHADFLAQYTNPVSAKQAAYRSFTYNGSTVDLTLVIDVYTVDAYPGRQYHDTDDMNQFLHQPYSMIHDTYILRKLIGNKPILWFAWDGSDTEHVGYRHYQPTQNGTVWRMLRTQPPAWFCVFVGLFGTILTRKQLAKGGVHWWHDQLPALSDPERVIPQDSQGWEPNTVGLPSPIRPTGEGKYYPREYRMAYLFSKIGELWASQLEDLRLSATFHHCQTSTNGSPFTTDYGEAQILYSAENKEIICIEIRGDSDSAIIACDPFGKENVTKSHVAKIRGGTQTIAFTTTGPMPVYKRSSTIAPTTPTTPDQPDTGIPAAVTKMAYTYDPQTRGFSLNMYVANTAGVTAKIIQTGSQGSNWQSNIYRTVGTENLLSGYNLRLKFDPLSNFTNGVQEAPLTIVITYQGTEFSIPFTPHNTPNDVPVSILPTTGGGTVVNPPTDGGNDFDYIVPTTYSTAWPEFDNRQDSAGYVVGEKAVLDNGIIRAEVWKRYGGAVAHVSFSGSNYNLLNQYDLGRGGSKGDYLGSPGLNYSQNGKNPHPAWQNMEYNPLEIGDTYHNPSEVVEFYRSDTLIYVKTLMRLWPLNGEFAQGYMEKWVRLNGRAVEMYYRTTYFRSDKAFYPVHQQEHNCMMINGSRRNVIFYNRDKPFTNDTVVSTPGFEVVSGVEIPNEQTPFNVTEPWMGVQVGDNQYIAQYAGYRFSNTQYARADTAASEFENATTYTAHVPMKIFDSDGIYHNRVAFILGSIQQIRDYVYAQKRDSLPNWHFTAEKGRNEWYVWKGYDQKEPFTSDVWDVTFNNNEGKIVSPVFSFRAADFNRLKIRMAYTGSRPKLNLMWLLDGQKEAGLKAELPQQEQTRFPRGSRASSVYDAQNIQFDVIGDGEERIYTIPLSGTQWKGIIQQFEVGYYYQWTGINPGENLRIRDIWGELEGSIGV